MVGDRNQLGPVVQCNSLKKLFIWFNKFILTRYLECSLFERLIKNGIETITLSEQYRMVPPLVEYISKEFYENKLKTSSKILFENNININWPNSKYPIIFYSIYGQEMSPNMSFSYYNL